MTSLITSSSTALKLLITFFAGVLFAILLSASYSSSAYESHPVAPWLRKGPVRPLTDEELKDRHDIIQQARNTPWNRSIDACPAQLEELKVEFEAHVKKNTWNFGLIDASELAPLLYRFFQPAELQVIFDIGANVGDVTAKLIRTFTVLDCFRFQKNVNLTNGKIQPCGYWKAGIVAIEPLPINFQVLKQRAELEQWNLVSYMSMQLALTDNVSPGDTVRFYTNQDLGDQQAGLHEFAGGTSNYINVTADTLDHLAATIPYYAGAPIFLLKVDAEGFDAHILNGSRRLLAEKKVQHIVFEYNKKWSYPHTPWNFRKAVNMLDELGYECYLMSPTDFIPIFGRWWSDSYVSVPWGNVYCAPSCDSNALTLVAYYNQNYMLPPGSCTC